MSPEVIIALAIVSFLVLIALEVPIALAIGGSGSSPWSCWPIPRQLPQR